MSESGPELAELARETRSSITVTRGMRGEYGWQIKRYEGNPLSIDDILDDIQIVDEALRLKYLPKASEE